MAPITQKPVPGLGQGQKTKKHVPAQAGKGGMMNWKKLSWLAVIFLVIAVMGLWGCQKLPNDLEESTGELSFDPPNGPSPPQNGPKVAGYPQYCMSLDVPFIKQVPPGDWGNTKNCGQACAVMLGGYFNGSPVASWVITDENQWLANYTGNSSYNQPNGWYTGGGSLSAYQELLRQYHDLNSTVYFGYQASDVINEVANGRPVIVGVMIKGGVLTNYGGVSHWALVVGWDGNVIVNDPGTSYGNHRSYSISDFEASWATQGKIYLPVWQ